MMTLLNYIQSLAKLVPLPLFTILGSFIEEVIAPIPSPLIMTLSGSLASSQKQPLTIIFYLALIGALSKTVGAWLVYFIADKLEDIIIDRFGKILGVSHKDTEGFGQYLNKGRRDYFVLFFLRALPIIPTAPVSVVSGLIKVNLKTYISASFFGTIFRNLFYLYLGYTSLEKLTSINSSLSSAESLGQTLLFFIILGLIAFWVYRKRRDSRFIHKVMAKYNSLITKHKPRS